MKRMFGLAIVALASASASPAMAKDVVVQMKTVGQGGMMVFEPMFVRAMPGDTVRFIPGDPTHNAEPIPTILPAGATVANGTMGKEFDLKVTTPGLYGIKCKPHYSMGMVALLQVGKGPSSNLAEAKAAKLPPLAAKRMTAALAQAN